MSKLTMADKTFLEAVLGMGEGYVLDFTNTSFAQFFDGLAIDIYEETYAEYGVSNANRLRTFWKLGSDPVVSSSLEGLADYIEAKKLSGGGVDVTHEQTNNIREIALRLTSSSSGSAPNTPGAITTGATVSRNLISIEIHDDIYSHIQRYLATEDYFHAVEESYKVVREKLRDLTGSEKSTEIFNENAQNNKHYAALFGKATPGNPAEADFFRGIGYLHLGVQFLRNEKAHTLATFVEPNLAIHYISLASLAYDLITRF
ncbi:MAG: TIGR02391 family protein, partial [Kineosporiaceae bacterium]|nr:TIGR02391 family protein [Aeromicrobium sp.]